MASTSTKAATTKSILTPTITLKGHKKWIRSISYFPDGQRMISGSWDKTTRQWDLKAGKEIEEARDTGIVKTFKGHSRQIFCIDISADNTLLASGSLDATARIWNLETGKLVAGPFKSASLVCAVRFSPDSKKLAVHDSTKTIYEFDAVTLETVGAPFEGHTKAIGGLALSFDGALLASASADNTIKLWAFESRQLLASFDVQNPSPLILSPDSCQLAYTTDTEDDCKICICDTPPDILAHARVRIPHTRLLFMC
ncbi:WD40 repeat-like protein [Suillus weaverae]|nr:WD40 repeat-like protein [Suillus weaverae]